MTDFKEFQAKSLDVAIADACDYFNTEREKLEIEILEDSKSGVFGIIGARKARIRARKVSPINTKGTSVFQRTEIIRNQPAPAPKEQKVKEPVQEKAKPAPVRENKEQNRELPREQAKEQFKEQTKESPKEVHKENPPERQPRPKRPQQEQVPFEPVKAPVQAAEETEDLSEMCETRCSLAELDQEKLFACGVDVIKSLTQAITGDIPVSVEVQGERLCLSISPEESGLLIGREGQTLASLEYLAARIISRAMDTQVRVHVEIGDYRSRQDDRLHDFALQLAHRVRMTNKSTSTRPLSAYQRRIVHLALQDMPDIQTRSTGEGAMKRVVIMRVKNQGNNHER